MFVYFFKINTHYLFLGTKSREIELFVSYSAIRHRTLFNVTPILFPAIITIENYERGVERIREIIEDNKGPNVWIASGGFPPSFI